MQIHLQFRKDSMPRRVQTMYSESAGRHIVANHYYEEKVLDVYEPLHNQNTYSFFGNRATEVRINTVRIKPDPLSINPRRAQLKHGHQKRAG